QSTGQTSMQASQPVQLSARITAISAGSFLRGLPAALAMRNVPVQAGRMGLPVEVMVRNFFGKSQSTGRSLGRCRRLALVLRFLRRRLVRHHRLRRIEAQPEQGRGDVDGGEGEEVDLPTVM